MKTSKFPILKSKRLTLRETTKIDLDQTFFLRSDPNVNKYIERSEEGKTKTLADATAFIDKIISEYEQGISISWSICLIDSDKMLGSICLWNYSKDLKSAELGYALHPDSQGLGIMSEALKLVLNCGFEFFNFQLIEAFTHTDNVNSKKLLLKNGFVFNKERKDLEDSKNDIFELKYSRV